MCVCVLDVYPYAPYAGHVCNSVAQVKDEMVRE